ncbi:transposase [Prauserella sediminis]|uniref:Transposase n=1 Tax=Prauserella sediminis TaxID=577680 RepID=A0A839XNN1_9PSEU|nr:hypothetical protein [Prauserella sediminis]MBB3662448.1 transposase [Prauserella sediminis]
MSAATPEEPDPVEIITDFGEVVPARPGGCPHCGEKAIGIEDLTCYRCRQPLPPIDRPDYS